MTVYTRGNSSNMIGGDINWCVYLNRTVYTRGNSSNMISVLTLIDVFI